MSATAQHRHMPDTTTIGSTPSAGARLGDRLDAEWEILRMSRRMRAQARTWRSPSGDHPLDVALDRVLTHQPHDLGDLVAATQGHEPAGDATLLRLVELARHDDLACRVVVQRLLPALVHGARRYHRVGDRVDAMSIAVPALCLAIRSYDTTNRTRHVAASLVSDTIFQAFRRPLRRRSSTEVVRSPDVFDDCADATEPSAHEILADVERDARSSGVEQRDLDLLLALTVHPQSAVAARLEVTTRTIRTRRDRALDNVREALGIAA